MPSHINFDEINIEHKIIIKVMNNAKMEKKTYGKVPFPQMKKDGTKLASKPRKLSTPSLLVSSPFAVNKASLKPEKEQGTISVVKNEKQQNREVEATPAPPKTGFKRVVLVVVSVCCLTALGVGCWLALDKCSFSSILAVVEASGEKIEPEERLSESVVATAEMASINEMEPLPEPEPELTPEERYNNGVNAPSDSKAAIAWYKEFSDMGVVDATYRLGMCYYSTRSIPMNFVKAVEMFQKAAEQGHQDAAIKLSECYEWGVGVDANEAEAARWRPLGIPRPDSVGEPADIAS